MRLITVPARKKMTCFGAKPCNRPHAISCTKRSYCIKQNWRHRVKQRGVLKSGRNDALLARVSLNQPTRSSSSQFLFDAKTAFGARQRPVQSRVVRRGRHRFVRTAGLAGRSAAARRVQFHRRLTEKRPRPISATTGFTQALVDHARPDPLRIVGGSGKLGLALMGQSGLSMGRLRGPARRTPSATTRWKCSCNDALHAHWIEPGQIERVLYPSLVEAVDDFLDGRIAALTLIEPWISRLRQQGFEVLCDGLHAWGGRISRHASRRAQELSGGAS